MENTNTRSVALNTRTAITSRLLEAGIVPISVGNCRNRRVEIIDDQMKRYVYAVKVDENSGAVTIAKKRKLCTR